MLWGNMLVGFSVLRCLTYFFMWLGPPRSILPSRPPTEALGSFFLACGGLVFVLSTEEVTVAAMRRGRDGEYKGNKKGLSVWYALFQTSWWSSMLPLRSHVLLSAGCCASLASKVGWSHVSVPSARIATQPSGWGMCSVFWFCCYTSIHLDPFVLPSNPFVPSIGWCVFVLLTIINT